MCKPQHTTLMNIEVQRSKSFHTVVTQELCMASRVYCHEIALACTNILYCHDYARRHAACIVSFPVSIAIT